jgi:hypothetical protein
MSADIEVVVQRVEKALHVPTLTVLEGEEGKTVFVVLGGKLERRAIQVGSSNWERTEVREGVREGDLVVVPTDRRALSEGKEVRAEVREERR